MVIESSKLEEQFVDIMFVLKDEVAVNTNYNQLITILQVIEKNHSQSPYDYITQYIFEHDEINNPDEAVMTFSALREMYKSKTGNDEDFIYNLLNSIERHIRLAIIQQDYILKQTKEVIRLNDSVNNELVSTKKDMNELRSSIQDMKVDKASVYTDFIAILGIFSALLFGLFVGFDVFKEFVVSMATTAKISRSIIMGSLLLIGLVSLVFLLLEGIAKLTDRNLKSCCKDSICKHNIYQRYPVFFISLLILTSAILIATIVLMLNMHGILYHSSVFIVVIVLLLLALWGISVKMVFQKNRPQSERLPHDR